MRSIKKIIVHCSANRPNVSSGYGVEEIRQFHIAPKEKPDGTFYFQGKVYLSIEDLPTEWQNLRGNGWDDIAYHYVVPRNGLVQAGRPVSIPGAHTYGHNTDSIGIVYIGGLDMNNKPSAIVTTKQKWALITCIRMSKLRWPDAVITSHRELSPDKDGDGVIKKHEWLKDCPSFDINAFLKRYAPDLQAA